MMKMAMEVIAVWGYKRLSALGPLAECWILHLYRTHIAVPYIRMKCIVMSRTENHSVVCMSQYGPLPLVHSDLHNC